MPVTLSRLSSGSARRDASAERHVILSMSDPIGFLLPVSVVFLIEIVAVLPEALSPLLGVLHLFARFGIVTGLSGAPMA
jgi:hypothetical protein